MAAIQPGKIRLRRFQINGIDLRQHVNCIKVYESMCKHYVTSVITIVDNNNVINTLDLKGTEPVSFAFDGGGRVYDTTHYITTIDGEESSENLRSVVYTINAVGPSYYYDRANLVQRSDVNIPGSNVIKSIFNQYLGGDAPLNILPSLGLIAKTDIGGYVTSNKKPVTAIMDIAKKLTYGGYKTGSTIFFRNRDEYVIAPLEHIFATMSSQEYYEQRATWGSEWHHIFTSTNAIISAATVIDKEKSTGRAGATNLSMASMGALNVFDIAKGMETMPPKFGISAGGIGQFVRGKLGGIQNVLQMDTRRNEPSTEQSLNAIQENMFRAKVKDGVQYLIKVPIQSGINSTVGRGITAKLIPPSGDQPRGFASLPSKFLVADLCHECFFDMRELQATTTMRVCAI